MKKSLLTKLAIIILVMGLLVSTVSAARLVVYVFDSANNPISGAFVSAGTGSIAKTGYTSSQGTYTFDIPKDRGQVYVAAGKAGYNNNYWSGKFTTYVRLKLTKK